MLFVRGCCAWDDCDDESGGWIRVMIQNQRWMWSSIRSLSLVH